MVKDAFASIRCTPTVVKDIWQYHLHASSGKGYLSLSGARMPVKFKVFGNSEVFTEKVVFTCVFVQIDRITVASSRYLQLSDACD